MKKVIIKGAVVLVFILLLLFFRWGFWSGKTFAFFSSDDSIPFLMSLHISQGENFPIFFYGQFYHGAFASYFYAIVLSMVGFSINLLVIVNILLFSLGCIFLNKVLKNSYYSLLYFIVPLPALIFVSTDSAVHFPFVFLFSSVLVWASVKLDLGFSLKWLIFECFLGGLFFWIYQGSLIILVPFFLLIIIRLFKYSKGISFETIKTLGFMAAGFLVGLLPLIYSEVKNNFVTLKFSFANPHPIPSIKHLFFWIYKFFGIPAYNHYNKYSTEFRLNEYIFYLIVLMTFLGFLLFILYSLKRKESPWLIYFSIISIILVAFSRFGRMIAENVISRNRYEVHSLILMPLGLVFFVFFLKKLDQFLYKYLFKSKIKVPFFLIIFIGLFFNLNSDMNRYSFKQGKEMNDLCVELSKPEYPTLFFAGYLRYFRCNSITREKRLFVPLPFPPKDFPFFSNIRYYPYALEACEIWEKENVGFITDSTSGDKIEKDFRHVFPDFGFKHDKIKDHHLFILPSQTPIEILLMNKYPHLYKFVNPLTEASVQTLNSDSKMIEIFFKKEIKVGGYQRLKLLNGWKTIEFPLHHLALTFRSNAPLKKGRYRMIYYNVSLPVKEGGIFDLEGELEPEVAFSHYTDSFNLIYFNRKKREHLNVEGIPVSSDFSIKINTENIGELDIEMVNPFNFESDLWQKTFKQEISLNKSNPKSILLENGNNRLSLKVKKGDTIRIKPRHKTFFKLTDSAFATYFKPMGVLITKVWIIYKNGKKKDVTPILVSDFLEKRKRMVRERFKKK